MQAVVRNPRRRQGRFDAHITTRARLIIVEFKFETPPKFPAYFILILEHIALSLLLLPPPHTERYPKQRACSKRAADNTSYHRGRG